MDGASSHGNRILLAIGGGALKHLARAPEFFLRSGASIRQARRHPGCVHAEVGKYGDLLLSYTGWRSPADMRDFASSGAHLRAVQRVPVLVDWFRFHHFAADTPPDFAEAAALWRDAVGLSDDLAGHLPHTA